MKWEHHVVPWREGILDWRLVFQILKGLSYGGVLSLHSEYEHLPREELLRVTRDDWQYLKSLETEVVK